MFKLHYWHSSKSFPLVQNWFNFGIEPNQNIPTANHQRHAIGKGQYRGGSSITPHSQRKEGLLVSQLKENYKNANISNHGYYVPPRGINKLSGINSQRSQPVLGGLRNNLAKKYNSNQYSIDHGKIRGLPPPRADRIINYRRGDLSSAKNKHRVKSNHQYNIKPSSAKPPSWWG